VNKADRKRLLERMTRARTPDEAQAVMADVRAWAVEHPDDIEVRTEAEMLKRLATAKVSALQGDRLSGMPDQAQD
jgi:hypothetical protein